MILKYRFDTQSPVYAQQVETRLYATSECNAHVQEYECPSLFVSLSISGQ